MSILNSLQVFQSVEWQIQKVFAIFLLDFFSQNISVFSVWYVTCIKCCTY